MPSWLTEDPTTLYVILGALAVAALGAGWTYRDRGLTLGARRGPGREPRTVNALALAAGVTAVLALLGGGAWLISHLVVTDREQIVLAVQEMADGVGRRDTDRVFRHVSNTFQSPRGNDKEAFRRQAGRIIEQGDAAEVVVYDFRFDEPVSRATRRGKVFFQFRIRGSVMGSAQDIVLGCTTMFHLDPDDRWRLQGFELTTPPPTNQPFPAPF